MPRVISENSTSASADRFAQGLLRIRPSAESLLESLPFTPGELLVLRSLDFKTTHDAVRGTIPDDYESQVTGCGPTRIRYLKQKIAIIAKYLDSDHDISDLGTLQLNNRESNALNRLGIHTFQDFAQADLTTLPVLPNVGAVTVQILREKQLTVRNDFFRTASVANITPESPLLSLPLSFAEIDILRSADITTVGELAWMNPAMFRLARQSESVVDRFRELQSSVRSKYPQSYVNRGYAFWTREIDAQGIETLPFFSEKANPGFSAEDFHPTYHALRELASMGLFRKTTLSGMQAAGITVLSDLLLLTPRQIAIFPAQRIEWYRERIKAFLLGGTVRLDTSSPETFVRSMLGAVLVPTAGNKQRVECVVLKLLGHTLAEISRRYGKSRERIRQYYT